MQVEVVLPGVLASDAEGARQVVIEVPADVPGGAQAWHVLDRLAERHPRLGRRLRDESGVVRRHVNLFVDGTDVRMTGGLQTRMHDGATLLVLPSVAGG